MTRQTAAMLAFVLVVAAGTRAFHLGDRVAWFDEAIPLMVARAPSASAAIVAARDEGHGPLWNLLMHAWTRVAPGELGARWLSVCLGVAAVGVIWVLGSHLAGPVAGTVSALLLALCPLHVWYSQEIRMYALQVLLIELSYLLMLLALERQRAGVWFLYVLVTALSLYAQYTSFLSLAGQNLFLVLTYREHRSSLKAWGLAQVGIALLFLPWLGQLMRHVQEKGSGYWVAAFQWDMPVKFFSLLSGSYLGDEKGRWIVVVITLAVLSVAMFVAWRERMGRQRALLLALWLFAPLILLVVVSLRQNLFLPRAILYVAPAFALLIGCGVESLIRRSHFWVASAVLGPVLILNLHALHGYYVNPNDWVKRPLRSLSTSIAREFRPGDVVIHSSQFTYRPCQFYLGQKTPQGFLGSADPRPGLFGIIGDGHVPTEAPGCRRVWLVASSDFLQPGLAGRVVDWMNAHHQLVQTIWNSPTLYVALYDRGNAPAVPAAADLPPSGSTETR